MIRINCQVILDWNRGRLRVRGRLTKYDSGLNLGTLILLLRKNHYSSEKNSIVLLGLKGQVAVITFNIKTPLRASSNRAKRGKTTE